MGQAETVKSWVELVMDQAVIQDRVATAGSVIHMAEFPAVDRIAVASLLTSVCTCTLVGTS